MSHPLLGLSITVSNALGGLAGELEDRGHIVAGERVTRARSAIDKAACRLILGHRIIYGPMRDICIHCLGIVDEHPNGRGREQG